MVFTVNAIYLFLAILIFIVAFPSLKFKSSGLHQRLYRIKNYGKADLKSLQEGIFILEPIRLLLGHYFSMEYYINRKKATMTRAGLEDRFNPLDILIIKVLFILFYLILGSIYFSFMYKLYSNQIIDFMANNLVVIILFFFILFLLIFIDQITFKILRAYRINSVMSRIVFFINLFKSNILAGDNLYKALSNCGTEISGVLGKEIIKTCEDIPQKGKFKALEDFAKRLDIDELTDFIHVILSGINTPTKDFSDFLNENELKIQEIKESQQLEKQQTKPIQAIMFNVLGFIAVVSVVIITFVLSLINYINKI